jgi:hypothetical protein
LTGLKNAFISAIPFATIFLLSAIFQNWVVPGPSFEVLLDPPRGELSIDSQTAINFSVVDTSPWPKHYMHDIALAADRVGDEDLPPGVSVDLDPAICQGRSSGVVNIETNSKTVPGSYTLQILGYGADGTQRNAFLVLEVHE